MQTLSQVRLIVGFLPSSFYRLILSPEVDIVIVVEQPPIVEIKDISNKFATTGNVPLLLPGSIY